MEYLDFFEIAKEVGSIEYPEPPGRRYNYGQDWQKKAKELMTPENAMFKETWRTGGMGGGSCWDDGEHDNHYALEGEAEPALADLDALLLKVCPNLSFLVYKNLENTLLERSTSSESEYYGNHTTYGHKFIMLKKLYDYLKSNKQI